MFDRDLHLETLGCRGKVGGTGVICFSDTFWWFGVVFFSPLFLSTDGVCVQSEVCG